MGVAPSRRHCIWVFAERGVLDRPWSEGKPFPVDAFLRHDGDVRMPLYT
jgi:hypothetical protein